METKGIKEIFRDAKGLLNQSIRICGWVKTIRDQKTFGFIELNDGTYFKNLQVVIEESLPNFSRVIKLSVGSALVIEGNLVESPGSKQPFELKATRVMIEGESTPDFPLQKKRHSFEYLRTIAHLRPRTNTFAAVFRVRSLAAYAIHQF
ncbi:MAG: OB-fold nucleic acid binding domain-containing protein, partial [Bacteroidota bacterium]